jgi:hypothetical protein
MGQRVGLLRRCYGGQGGLRITSGEESRGRSVSPAAASGSILARAGLGVEGRSFGKLPGGEAKLLRVMWWSGVQRNGRSTVRPRRLCGGGKKEGGAGGPQWRLGLGFRGGVGAALCRVAAVPLTCGPEARELAGDLGPLRRRRKGKREGG